MATIDDTRFTGLLDAEERHRAAPHSFSIPRSDVRKSLTPGATVKLLFGFGGGEKPAAERMWVEVTERTDEPPRGPRYVGRLLNRPQAISDVQLGDDVDFEPWHVAGILRDMPGAPRSDQFAIVSDRIWSGGDPPARARRMSMPDEQLSGWVLSAEADSLVPPADLAGYGPVSHGQLSDRFRSFDSVEDEPPGTSWHWDEASLEWVRDG